MPFKLASQNLKLITPKSELIISVLLTLFSIFVGTFTFVFVMKREDFSNARVAEVNGTELMVSLQDNQFVYINKLDCSISYIVHIASAYVSLFVLRLQLPNFCSKINILDNFMDLVVSNCINSKQRKISIFATVVMLFSCFVSYVYNVKEQNLIFICVSAVLTCAVAQSFGCEVLFASCCYSLWTRLQVLNETLYKYFYSPLRKTPKNG